jgi:hypothetical protein
MLLPIAQHIRDVLFPNPCGKGIVIGQPLSFYAQYEMTPFEFDGTQYVMMFQQVCDAIGCDEASLHVLSTFGDGFEVDKNSRIVKFFN